MYDVYFYLIEFKLMFCGILRIFSFFLESMIIFKEFYMLNFIDIGSYMIIYK